MNSRKQGDIGTSFAIAYFSGEGYTVNVPLSDSQPYDLIIEKEGNCYRVQCKTSFKRNKHNKFWVETRTISNTRGKKLEIRKLTKLDCELLFVMDGDGNFYVIPSTVVENTNGLLMSKFTSYIVKIKLKFENTMESKPDRITGTDC